MSADGMSLTYPFDWELSAGVMPSAVSGGFPAPATSSPPLNVDDGSGMSPDEAPERKVKGGRPRDLVWSYYTGDLAKVTCIFCQWTTERPKAFRMRQHILACPKVPDADRDKIRASQELKDKANAAKVAGAAANDKLMAENSGGGPDMDLGIGTSELTPPPSATDPSRKRKADPKDLNRMPQAKPRTAPPQHIIPQPPPPQAPPLRSPVTCHVLDATYGKPASGMNCRLDRLTPNGFVLLSSGQTDMDGRCNNLLAPSARIEVGIYKITFFTQDFFNMRATTTFYPFVEITFEIREEDSHYHVPLLLSPYAYSTYRGS